MKFEDLYELVSDRIKKHEGFSGKPYRDIFGNLTIGYGRNLSSVGITKDEAEYLFINDLRKALELFEQYFPDDAKENLTTDGIGVIVEMIFNMGISKVLEFKKMIKAIQDRNPEQAAIEMLNSQWARQVGNRAKLLSQIMREKGILHTDDIMIDHET